MRKLALVIVLLLFSVEFAFATLSTGDFVDPKNIDISNALVMGNPNAQNKLIVYSDPDAPYCKLLHRNLRRMTDEDRSICVYLLLYPLPFHKEAYSKSISLINNPSQEAIDAAFALDGKVLTSHSSSAQSALDNILAKGKALEIGGVPVTILPNGRVHVGYKKYDEFKQIVTSNLSSTHPPQPSTTKIATTNLSSPKPPQPSAPSALHNRTAQQIANSDVDQLPTWTTPKDPKAYAIVIGIERYRQSLPNVDFARQDARTVSTYLTKVLGYPEENVVTLLDDRALQSDLKKYLEKWLQNNVELGGKVFIYYSGHGAPNPQTGDAYLVPYDGDPAFIDETGYSLERLYAALGKLPAQNVVVAIDSCFSGVGNRSVIAPGTRAITLKSKTQLVIPPTVKVLAASSNQQTSSTYPEQGHGLFTYYFLKGIKNQNVVMGNGDLELNKLFTYLKPQVEKMARKRYNNEQTPQLFGMPKH